MRLLYSCKNAKRVEMLSSLWVSYAIMPEPNTCRECNLSNSTKVIFLHTNLKRRLSVPVIRTFSIRRCPYCEGFEPEDEGVLLVSAELSADLGDISRE